MSYNPADGTPILSLPRSAPAGGIILAGARASGTSAPGSNVGIDVGDLGLVANSRPGGPFHVTSYDATTPGYAATNSVLADITDAVRCFGAEATVEFGPDGYRRTYVTVYDGSSPAHTVFKDGRFNPFDMVAGAKWVLKESVAAARANVPLITSDPASVVVGDTGRYTLAGSTYEGFYLRLALATGGTYAVPTGAAGDPNWKAVAPPVPAGVPLVNLPELTLLTLYADHALGTYAGRDLRISARAGGLGDVLVHVLGNGALATEDAYLFDPAYPDAPAMPVTLGVSGTATTTTARVSYNDTAVRGLIAANTTNITANATAISAEATTRANADTALQNSLNAINAIIGSGVTDADTIVNTVSELLQVFATYSEGVDIAALLNGKVAISSIVNLLTSTATNAPLSAAQGKVLKDALDALTTTVNGKQTALGYTPENAANKATANGYASLDGTGKVPASQLPTITGATNITSTPAPTKVTVNSSTGLGTDLLPADTTNAGLLLPAQVTKLSNLSGTNTGDQNIPATSLGMLATDATGVPAVGQTMSVQAAWNRLATWAGAFAANVLAVALAGYAKATSASAIAVTDTALLALGKLEYKADLNTSALLNRLNNRDAWAASTPYTKNDVFNYQGSLFLVLNAYTTPAAYAFDSVNTIPFAVLPAVPQRAGTPDFTQEAFYGTSVVAGNPISLNTTGAKAGVAVTFDLQTTNVTSFPTTSTAASGSQPIQVLIKRGSLIGSTTQTVVLLYTGQTAVNAVLTHVFFATIS